MSEFLQQPPSGSITLLVPYDHSDSSDDTLYKIYNFQPKVLSATYFLEHSRQILLESSQVIILDQTTVACFDVYEHWLLEAVILLSGEKGAARTVEPDKQQARESYDKLLCCCSLACMLGDDTFLDALVTHLIYTLRLFTSFQSQLIRTLTHKRVDKIISEAGVYSGLFRIVAHAYAWFASIDEIRVLAFSKYNLYFKSQVMQSMVSMRDHKHMDGNQAMDFVVGVCHYHTHGFYEACTLQNL